MRSSRRSRPAVPRRAAAAAERVCTMTQNTAASMDHIVGLLAQVAVRRGILLVALGALLAAGCDRAPSTGNPKTASQTGTTASAPASDVAQDQPPAIATKPASTSQDAGAPGAIVAFYFHRTVRCPTCLSIERQSQEAVELLYSGRVGFRAVNIEEPGNEHYEKDFALESQSLVLVEMTTERVIRWKLLSRTWDLINDPLEFQKYVVSEVAEFLGS